ncbi:myb-like protein A [Octopus bimaculoides]|uniref:Uncharacterized protein n=1 Tax=Octopus bimaculoides TaxID=37653 RepID=A0A0L8HRT7_OCTBM|nr:myb-like protein A [Octopus bimaculoides]XP_052832201.1 myb-like protein A [Octopus bimaculoides]
MNERNLHHHRQLHEWYELHKFNQLNNNNNNNNSGSGGGGGGGSGGGVGNMCVTASLTPYLSPQKAMWIENWRQEVNKAFFKIPDTQVSTTANTTAQSSETNNNNNNNNNNKNNNSIIANGVVVNSKLKNGILPKNGIKLNQSLNGHLSSQHTPAKSAEWKDQVSKSPLQLQSKVLSCSFSDLNLQPGYNLEKKSSRKRNGKFCPNDQNLLKFSDTKTSAKSVSSKDCQHARLNEVHVGVFPPSDESGEELFQSKPKDGVTTLALRSSSNSLLNVISVDDCRATVHYHTPHKSTTATAEGYQPLEQKNSPQSTTKTQKRLLKRLQARYLSQNGTDPTALCTSNHSSIASEHLEDSLCPATASKDFNAVTHDTIHKESSRTTKSNSFTASSDSPVFKRLNTNLRKHMKTLLQSQRNAVKSRLKPAERQSSTSGCCLRVCELQGDCNPSDEHLHSS